LGSHFVHQSLHEPIHLAKFHFGLWRRAQVTFDALRNSLSVIGCARDRGIAFLDFGDGLCGGTSLLRVANKASSDQSSEDSQE